MVEKGGHRRAPGAQPKPPAMMASLLESFGVVLDGDVEQLYWTGAYSLGFYLTLTVLVNLLGIDAWILSKSKDKAIREVGLREVPPRSLGSPEANPPPPPLTPNGPRSLARSNVGVGLALQEQGGRTAQGLHVLHCAEPVEQHR